MYELIQVSENDYYIDCPAKIGIVKINSTEVVAIDSGNDKDAGKKVLKHIEANGWKLKAVYNTHSHADHIGGNKLLQERTLCSIYAKGQEAVYTNMPALEPITLYGGSPLQELQNKFLMAQASNAQPLTAEVLPEGWELLDLPGHSFDMVGFRTPDNTVYLGDCVSSAETLAKYGIGYLWNPEDSFLTLEKVQNLRAKVFVPAHAPVCSDITELVQINRDALNEVSQRILAICAENVTFETLLQKVFESYGLQMNVQQYALIGSTVRSYLSCLCRSGKVQFSFENNSMLWQTI